MPLVRVLVHVQGVAPVSHDIGVLGRPDDQEGSSRNSFQDAIVLLLSVLDHLTRRTLDVEGLVETDEPTAAESARLDPGSHQETHRASSVGHLPT